MQHHGIVSQLVWNEARTKANLYSTIGPLDRSGILLSGHTDVVPVTGQHWSSHPFDLFERDGIFYGRGTADMKTFIAIVLALVPKMLATRLSVPIHIALSYDEEIGCVGVRRLLETMANMPIQPAMCIVGEPTDMKVVNAHKGKLAYRVTVTGLESHSSLPNNGVNAVEIGAELIVYIRKLAATIAERGPFDRGFDLNFTTVHTGNIHGGSALNIVPNRCDFEFEIRNIPQHDPQSIARKIFDYAARELEPGMKELCGSCGIRFEALSGYPAMSTHANAEVVTFVQKLAQDSQTSKVAFGTEGGLFTQQLGIPTVVCGPGSIRQAHKPDEFITLSQIDAMEEFMNRLIGACNQSSVG